MTIEKKLFKGVWTGNRGVDRQMINECLQNYSHFDLNKDSVVLDLGANIGGFASMCKSAGVRTYVGFEPDPVNCEILRLNCDFPGAEVRESACSMSNEKELIFRQTLSNNAACSGSIVNTKGRKKTYAVKNENILQVLDEIRPNVLKIDIEGAEREWLETTNCKFPSFVEQISLEIHHKEIFKRMNDEWLDIMKEDFDILLVHANSGFQKETAAQIVYENLGIDIRGVIFGIDIVARRKI